MLRLRVSLTKKISLDTIAVGMRRIGILSCACGREREEDKGSLGSVDPSDLREAGQGGSGGQAEDRGARPDPHRGSSRVVGRARLPLGSREIGRPSEDGLTRPSETRGDGTTALGADNCLVRDLLDDYLSDLVERRKKSLPSIKCRVRRLKGVLGDHLAALLRTTEVEEYRRQRLSVGVNRATIDREIEILRSAFRLAARREQIAKIPFFPSFNVSNVRQGFFEPAQTEAIVQRLPGALAEIVRFASLSGWRISEILGLRWSSVDLGSNEIRLATSKNGRPRTLGMTGELLRLVKQRWREREYISHGCRASSEYVFHRRRGRPVSYGSYRKAFVQACRDAGIVGRTTHDFRRTVARDLRRLGVDESTCMSVTGHESSSMFRRYAGIIDPSEQLSALARRDALLTRERKRAQRRKATAARIK